MSFSMSQEGLHAVPPLIPSPGWWAEMFAWVSVLPEVLRYATKRLAHTVLADDHARLQRRSQGGIKISSLPCRKMQPTMTATHFTGMLCPASPRKGTEQKVRGHLT